MVATETERDPLAEACAWLVERRQDRGIPRTFEVIVTGMREAEAHVAALVECAEEQGRQVAALRAALRAVVADLAPGPCPANTCPGCRHEMESAAFTARAALAGEEVAGGDGA